MHQCRLGLCPRRPHGGTIISNAASILKGDESGIQPHSNPRAHLSPKTRFHPLYHFPDIRIDMNPTTLTSLTSSPWHSFRFPSPTPFAAEVTFALPKLFPVLSLNMRWWLQDRLQAPYQGLAASHTSLSHLAPMAAVCPTPTSLCFGATCLLPPLVLETLWVTSSIFKSIELTWH